MHFHIKLLAVSGNAHCCCKDEIFGRFFFQKRIFFTVPFVQYRDRGTYYQQDIRANLDAFTFPANPAFVDVVEF